MLFSLLAQGGQLRRTQRTNCASIKKPEYSPPPNGGRSPATADSIGFRISGYWSIQDVCILKCMDCAGVNSRASVLFVLKIRAF
jgi:hypothetical protein